MKSAGLLCLFSLGLLLSVTAQPTITNAVFPAVGDTLFFAVDDQPQGVVMTPPGGPQQWDFSNLQPSASWQQIFQDPLNGPDSGAFPAANLLYQTPDGSVDVYLQASGSQVSVLGFSGPDPLLLGIDLVAQFNPPVVQQRAPVNFFDINQTSSGLLIPFLPGLLPGAGQLPFTADSLRIRTALSRLDVVDAWGALAVPGGTFDVLRQKSIEYRERRLDAKIQPLGWLDVTDIANQNLGLGLGVDTIVTYQFLSDQSKEPIAVCTTDNSQLLVVSIQYKNLDTSTGSKKPERSFTDLAVFPNPAGAFLQVRAGDLDGGDYTLSVFTLLGQEVFRRTFREASGKLEEELDIANLGKGAYVCKISDGKGRTGQALFVKG